MVWEAQVVAKGSGMRSRPKAPALHERSARKPAKERLYALRRRFVVVVDAEGIAVKVLGNFAPWWCAASPRQIIAKKRLVKIIDADGQTIMIRLAGEDKALEFAAAVRDEWGLEPLMHTAVVEDDGVEDRRELENIAALFMTSPEFRERVRQLHDSFAELWDA